MPINPYLPPAEKCVRPVRPWSPGVLVVVWTTGAAMLGLVSGILVLLLLVVLMHEDHEPPLPEYLPQALAQAWLGAIVFPAMGTVVGGLLGLLVSLTYSEIRNWMTFEQPKPQADETAPLHVI